MKLALALGQNNYECKYFLNEGINQKIYYYRDCNQNEVDMALLRDGKLSCVEIKSGQNFNASATKAFALLSSTKYEVGKNAIVCTAEKPSILNDGTIVMPFFAI